MTLEYNRQDGKLKFIVNFKYSAADSLPHLTVNTYEPHSDRDGFKRLATTHKHYKGDDAIKRARQHLNKCYEYVAFHETSNI